jgi:hypothetical protein
MMRRMRRVLFVSVLALAAPAQGANLAEHKTAHFTFRYPAIDAASIAGTAERVEREYERVLRALSVTDMPRVNVTFYTSHAALEAATRHVAGVVPSWTCGLVTAQDQIHCMSPNDPSWGPYERRVGSIAREVRFAVGVVRPFKRSHLCAIVPRPKET